MAGGGGKSSTPTQQTITQTNLPEYIRPYVESTARRAEEISNRPYEAYSGPRIAGFNSDQGAAFDLTRGLSSTYQPLFEAGTQNTAAAGTGFANATQYTPGSFSADQWNNGIASNYMNPYITNVLQQQQALAGERFAADQTKSSLARAKAGSFGGYRHGIADATATSQFGRNMDLMAAEGLNRAYDTAYQNFSGDRGASMEAQRLGEQSRQFGANLGLQGAQGLAGVGQQLYQQGSMARTLAGQDVADLRSIGQQQQDLNQSGMDLAYNDFVNQRDYDRGQLNFLNSIIRGMPVTSTSDVSTYQHESPWANLLGLGIGATGLLNSLGGQGGGTGSGTGSG